MKIFDREEHKKEVKEALEDGTAWKIIRAFFFPRMARRFLLRLGIVIAAAYILFRFFLLPMYIKGGSMLPTYPERGFNFCWTGAFWFRPPTRGDVVIVRYGTDRIMLLKRIVALEGEKVAFRKGKLFVNGREMQEPYIKGPCDWELPERTVEKDHFYIVGDNRSVPMDQHRFGSVRKRHVKGAPLW